MLVGCGEMCDRLINGMCVVYNGNHIDPDGIQYGADLAQSIWSDRFGAVDLNGLAGKYNLVVHYENSADFGYDDFSGYFTWDYENSKPPEIHIVYRNRYNNDDKCMTGYVLGHELFHFFVFTVGDGEDGHSDPEIWLEANNWMLTAEYDLYIGMAEFCGLEF